MENTLQFHLTNIYFLKQDQREKNHQCVIQLFSDICWIASIYVKHFRNDIDNHLARSIMNIYTFLEDYLELLSLNKSLADTYSRSQCDLLFFILDSWTDNHFDDQTYGRCLRVAKEIFNLEWLCMNLWKMDFFDYALVFLQIETTQSEFLVHLHFLIMEAVLIEGSVFIGQLCNEQKLIDWVMNHSENGDFYNSKLSCLDIINELLTVT